MASGRRQNPLPRQEPSNRVGQAPSPARVEVGFLSPSMRVIPNSDGTPAMHVAQPAPAVSARCIILFGSYARAKRVPIAMR